MVEQVQKVDEDEIVKMFLDTQSALTVAHKTGVPTEDVFAIVEKHKNEIEEVVTEIEQLHLVVDEAGKINEEKTLKNLLGATLGYLKRSNTALEPGELMMVVAELRKQIQLSKAMKTQPIPDIHQHVHFNLAQDIVNAVFATKKPIDVTPGNST